MSLYGAAQGHSSESSGLCVNLDVCYSGAPTHLAWKVRTVLGRDQVALGVNQPKPVRSPSYTGHRCTCGTVGWSVGWCERLAVQPHKTGPLG